VPSAETTPAGWGPWWQFAPAADVDISFLFAASHSVPARATLLAREDGVVLAHLGSGGCGPWEPFGRLRIPPGAGQEPGATISSFLLHVLGLQEKSPGATAAKRPLPAKGSASAPPRLHAGPLGLGDAAFHRGGLTLCLSTASPLAWQSSAPEVGSFTPSALPHSCSEPPDPLLLPSLPGRGALRGRWQLPSVTRPKATAETRLRERAGTCGHSRLGCRCPEHCAWWHSHVLALLLLLFPCSVSSSPVSPPASAPLGCPRLSFPSGPSLGAEAVPTGSLRRAESPSGRGGPGLLLASGLIPGGRPGGRWDVMLLAWPRWQEEAGGRGSWPCSGRAPARGGKVPMALGGSSRRCHHALRGREGLR